MKIICELNNLGLTPAASSKQASTHTLSILMSKPRSSLEAG